MALTMLSWQIHWYHDSERQIGIAVVVIKLIKMAAVLWNYVHNAFIFEVIMIMVISNRSHDKKRIFVCVEKWILTSKMHVLPCTPTL